MSTLGVCVHGFLLASLTKLTTMHFFFFCSEHVLSANALMCIFQGPNASPLGRSNNLNLDLPGTAVDLVNLRQHPSIWILKTSFRIPKGHFLVYRPRIEKSVVVETTNFDCKSLWIVRVRARLCAAGRSLMHH